MFPAFAKTHMHIGLLNSLQTVLLHSLPTECLSLCLAALGGARALCRVAATCATLRHEAFDEFLWEALYFARWPAWTLLEPREASGGFRVNYRLREQAYCTSPGQLAS